MASKSELIARLEDLLGQEDVEQAAEAVEALKEAYEAIIAHEHQDKQASAEEATLDEQPAQGASPEEAPPLAIESAPPADEHDKLFKQLLDRFNHGVNELRRKKAQEEAENLEAKRAVMEELRNLVNVENIGTAFQRFNELQELWKRIGPVPQHQYRELQSEYSHLLDDFFYHIRIYKELRDHDLKKNTGLKQALISDMQSLATKDNVKELETMVREYQERWQQIGPVAREEWESIREGFWNATRVVYDKIHEHYKARRAEHEANLQAKQELVTRVHEVLANAQAVTAKEWKTLTDQIIEAQNTWKTIGFATKKDNERIWKEFRTACNAFFDAKKAYFDGLKEQFRGARERKQALLDEALALKDSRDWRQTADKLKAIQQQWKEAGSAGPRDEHRLWTRFREACDAFFKARKENFAQQDAEQAEHAKVKETLLKELEAFQLTGDRNADIEQLKAFTQRWMTSGRVSPKQFEAFNDRYKALMDKHYGQLKLDGEERRRMQFKGHIEQLKGTPEGVSTLERESRFVKRRIEELQTEIRQMEQNMGMFNFKSASGASMKQEMEKRIERTRREVDRLREQQVQLQRELRSA